MYAIFKDGGHQHKAEVGRKMYVELRDVKEGDVVVFDEVLLVVDEKEVVKEEKTVVEKEIVVGQPTIEGAKVEAKVLGEVKGPKVIIRWFRRRKNSRRNNGHRQRYTLVQIDSITT